MKNLLISITLVLVIIFTAQAQKTFGWGENANGELGQNSTSASERVVQISAIMKNSSLNAAGNGFTIVHTKSPWTTYSFGKNDVGQSGIDTTSPILAPMAIASLNGVELIALASGDSHTVIIAKNGAVWSWGKNNWGQLGLGNMVNQKTPQRVTFFNSISNGTSYNQVTCGANHCMIYSSVMESAVYGWGRNNKGQLSNGNTTDMATPVFVPSYMMQNVSQISCGGDHCLALSSDGSVLCSGENAMGQCGFNSTAQFTVARGIVSTMQFMKVKACATHSLALTKSGKLYSWGSNTNGELGQGSTGGMNVLPTAVNNAGTDNSTGIYCGSHYSITVKNTAVWGFGDNSKKQLTLATPSTVNAPQLVADFKTVAGFPSTSSITFAVSTGSSHGVVSINEIPAPTTPAPTTQAPTTQAPTTAPSGKVSAGSLAKSSGLITFVAAVLLIAQMLN